MTSISFGKTTRRLLRRLAGFIFARHFFARIFIALIAGTIALVLFFSNALDKFELVALDLGFRMKPAPRANTDIVLIPMSEDSIDAIGAWPWPREWHAALLSALTKYGARQVIFDVIFDQPSIPSQDLVFAEAVKRSGTVYLPYVFQFKKGDLPIKSEPDGNVRNVIRPLDELAGYARGQGYVNVAPDGDGTLRRAPLLMDIGPTRYYQIAFRAACDYLDMDVADIVLKPGRHILIRNSPAGDIKIPVDRHNQMLINWAGTWKSAFRHISYIDIISSYNQALAGEEPLIDPAQLKDKICIVGLTAAGLYDIRPTPLEPSYPSVGANANIINNILNKDFVGRVGEAADVVIIYLAALLIASLVSKARFLRGTIYTAAALAGYIAAAFLVLSVWGRCVTVVYPAISIFISALGISLYNETILAFERKKYFDLSIRDGLTKLFNIRHFREMLEREFKACVGRKTKKLSLIMTDVDHFKNFNDTYGHQVGDFVLKRVARMFKEGSRAQDVVARYGGEEFIMMLPGTEIGDAKRIAERIRERIDKTPLTRFNEQYSVTVSLGVATLQDEATKEELIKKVDDALYMAKKSGRNRVCVV